VDAWKNPPIEIPLGEKKQEIWEGTMVHAPGIGSLSYRAFTKVKLSILQYEYLKK